MACSTPLVLRWLPPAPNPVKGRMLVTLCSSWHSWLIPLYMKLEAQSKCISKLPLSEDSRFQIHLFGTGNKYSYLDS